MSAAGFAAMTALLAVPAGAALLLVGLSGYRLGARLNVGAALLTLLVESGLLPEQVPPLAEQASKKSERPAIPAHFPDPVVRQMIQLDLDVIAHLDEQLRVLEQDLALKAKAHDAFAYHLIRSVPGIGRILTLVILYEIERIERFATVGQFASYARLVKCAKESAGKRHGYSSKKIGNAYLKWAFSEAAVLFLRNNPPAQQGCDSK